jgi:vitamin B12 transporter
MRPRFTAALAAAGLLGGWSSGLAQPAPHDPAAPAAALAETLVVTAGLEPAPASELPAAVDVVEADEIERRQSDLALDLLRTLPGLALTQSGSPGKVASLLTRGTGSAHTLVLLDGVILNDAVLGGFDWSSLPLDGVERVEVARGPFSAVWGSSAVGGVVQLVTRTPDRLAGALRLEGGSDGYRRGGLSAAAPLGALAVDLAGHARRGDGELPNDYFDAREAQARLHWRPLEGLRLGLTGRAGEATIGLPFDFAGTPSPERAQDTDTALVALPVEWTRGDARVEGLLARTESDLDLRDPNDPFAAGLNRTEREQARVRLGWRASDAFWLGGGVERERQEASTESAFGPGLERARQTTDALFAHAGWSGERVRFEGGVRRDDHSAFGGETSLRGGAVLSLGGSARLRASYGESFRAPSLGDLYFPSFGNPELRPERGESLELGFEAETELLRARLAGFRTELDDLIQFDPVLFLPFNIGRARTQGLEVSVESRASRWRGRADVTWLDAEDLEADAPLPRRPEWSASLVAFWTGERGDAGVTARYVGAREDVGRVPLGGYSTLEVAGSWRARDGVAPFARVENLLDRRYEEARGFPAPGRSWVVGVSLRAGR